MKRTLLFIFAFTLILIPSFAQEDIGIEYENATAYFIKEKLIVSTGKIQCTWAWTGKGLKTVSIINQKSGKDFTVYQRRNR